MTEVFTVKFTTSLAAALTTATRPTTITVAATQAIYGTGSFSIAIFDAGTDAAPVNYEVLQVTAGGGTTTWTVTTEAGYTPATHANGSTVIATILTPRALAQPMTDHVAAADPHTIYVQESNFTTKGDLLVGTGSSTFTRQLIGADGTSPIADSTRTSGIRWTAISLTSVLTHMGDLVIGGLLGLASRLGIGTIGQGLVVVQNAPTIATPVSPPTCAATGSGGSLSNGTAYDFAYAWETPDPPPDGGITPPSPITTFTATSSGIVAVTCPAAPSAGLTLVIYANLTTVAVRQQATLANASISTTNIVNVTTIVAGAFGSAVNTTGGIGPAWQDIGSVTSVALSAPSEFSVSGSPVTSSGTLGFAKASQSQNTFYAGPTTGSATAPTFRSMVASDLPTIYVPIVSSASLTATAKIITVVAGTPPTGRHEEFLPAINATTITLSLTPLVVLVVALNGTVKSITSAHYSVKGTTITFAQAFAYGDQVTVSYLA